MSSSIGALDAGLPPCASVTLGHSADSWSQLPWTSHGDPDLIADATVYVLPKNGSGGFAELFFQNPWGLGHALLVLSSTTGYVEIMEKEVRMNQFGLFGKNVHDN